MKNLALFNAFGAGFAAMAAVACLSKGDAFGVFIMLFLVGLNLAFAVSNARRA